MRIRSGYIRYQSRKLSEIAQNFGRFFGPPKFFGAGLPKIVPSLSLLRLAARRLKKFREDTPNSPEVIEPNTLNFRPNFKFSRLKFFGGPPSHFRCALARLGQSVARVQISGRSAQHLPKGRNIVSQKVRFSGSVLTSYSL